MGRTLSQRLVFGTIPLRINDRVVGRGPLCTALRHTTCSFRLVLSFFGSGQLSRTAFLVSHLVSLIIAAAIIITHLHFRISISNGKRNVSLHRTSSLSHSCTFHGKDTTTPSPRPLRSISQSSSGSSEGLRR